MFNQETAYANAQDGDGVIEGSRRLFVFVIANKKFMLQQQKKLDNNVKKFSRR